MLIAKEEKITIYELDEGFIKAISFISSKMN